MVTPENSLFQTSSSNYPASHPTLPQAATVPCKPPFPACHSSLLAHSSCLPSLPASSSGTAVSQTLLGNSAGLTLWGAIQVQTLSPLRPSMPHPRSYLPPLPPPKFFVPPQNSMCPISYSMYPPPNSNYPV